MHRIAALLVVALILLQSASTAQSPTPQFVLPVPPYDYGAEFMCHGCRVRGERTPEQEEQEQREHAVSNALAALGRVLFYDPQLSQNGSVACASCHEQARAFADGRRFSRGFAGHRTRRNAMSIVDLDDHQGPLFWDGRAATLTQMVLMPIADPIEMGMPIADLVARLRARPEYRPLFTAAFGDHKANADRIALALARFVRAIRSRSSRFDKALADGTSIEKPFPGFTDAENRGKALFFIGQRSCASCHVGGYGMSCGASRVIDPRWLDSSTCTNNGLEGSRPDDAGMARHTKSAADRGKFRAPSLRNVELTAPYMHDGRFATLEEVVRFYATGVRESPTLDGAMRPGGPSGGWGGDAPPMSTNAQLAVGPTMGFPMTPDQQRDLVAFLKTLTDPDLTTDPRFANPFQ